MASWLASPRKGAHLTKVEEVGALTEVVAVLIEVDVDQTEVEVSREVVEDLKGEEEPLREVDLKETIHKGHLKQSKNRVQIRLKL